MTPTRAFTALLCFAVAACSGGDSAGGEAVTSTDAMIAPGNASAEAAPASGSPKLAVALPRIAYSYSIGFSLPAARLAATQRAHVDLCARLGPARCQLLATERETDPSGVQRASTRVRVAAPLARGFIDSLGRSVASAGGRAIEEKVEGEDVAKAMVDAGARIRQRELLVGRLTEILRTRQGSVGDLVAAERAVAEAQEELDQAKGWLAELQTRVAMSTVAIRYDAVGAGPPPARAELGEAVSNSWSSFVAGLQWLLVLGIYLLPWLFVVVPLVLLIRWLIRVRRRAGKSAD